MFTALQNPLSFIGRVLLAALFLPAGIAKITGFAGTVGYISSVNMPFPTLSALFAILFEVGGGLALVFGLGTRWAALALSVFTLVASFFFHAFWAVPAEAAMVTQLLFIKNIAVVGGLLTLAAWGPGGWSLDARRGN
jgi:putative oxidoreductase